VECPTSVSAASNCMEDTSWLSNAGWTTQLTSTFRHATVAYSRENATILSHDYTSDAVPAPVSAQELLTAYQVVFSSFPSIAALTTLITDSQVTALFSLYIQPAIIWSNLRGTLSSSTDPALLARAQDTIQCILAIMLYFSQPAVFARALSLNTNLTSEMQIFKEHLPLPDIESYEARMRYQLVMNKTWLILYLAICVVALILCIAGLILSFLGNGIPQTTSYQGWDEQTRCIVLHEDQDTLPKADTKQLITFSERTRTVFVG
jgi:hypothetical protein